jgi:hypothetical protein
MKEPGSPWPRSDDLGWIRTLPGRRSRVRHLPPVEAHRDG